MKFPPLAEQSCNSCRYFRPRASGYEGGRCHRHAPQIGPCGPEWPTVVAADWCGEWAAVEADDG